MATYSKPSEVVSWDAFKWVVTGLLGLLVAFTALTWKNMSDEVSDLKKTQRETTKEIAEGRIELVRAVSAVEKQIALTNQKLDALTASSQAPRR